MPPSAPGSSRHSLRFYDRDRFLPQDIAEFVMEGLDRREQIVVLATAEHWAAARDLLDARAGKAIVSGQLVFEDAEMLLNRITVNDVVSTERFAAYVKPAIAGARRPLRFFGELVSMMAARGQVQAAMEIEQLGQQLADRGNARVVCAYHLDHVSALHEGIEQAVRCHDMPGDPRLAKGGAPVVLLAEDFEDARELYRTYLEARGYRVVTAADGVEAVERAATSRPSLVLLDVQMPRMSGVQALHALRKDAAFAGVPIVALTAHALDNERDLFVSEGFAAVLSKPFMPDDLFRFIGALVSSTPARDFHSI